MDVAILRLCWDVIKTVGRIFGKVESEVVEPVSDTSPLAVIKRFIELFEQHGVARTQIPVFFGRGLELRDLSDDRALLNVIAEKHLSAVVDLFGVRREWLDGVSQEIYPTHCYYKKPKKFLSFIAELKSKGVSSGELYVSSHDVRRGMDSILVFQEQIGTAGNVPIFRYHICDGWVFSYWKSRAYLAACVAAAWDINVYVHGYNVPYEAMKKIQSNCHFIGVDQYHGGTPTFRKRWEPEDLAAIPSAYLKGVDEGAFGKISALQKWLDLEADGYMCCGFGDPPRENFEKALGLIRDYKKMGILQQWLFRFRAKKSGENLFVFD